MKNVRSMNKLYEFIQVYHLDEFIHSDYMQYVQLHEFAPQELIVREDEPPKYLYFLLEGEARVSPSSEDGKLALLDYIRPMDLLGDIEYFFSEVNYHSVMALTSCLFLAIPIKHLDTYFKDDVVFYKFLCLNMARKMRSTSIKYSRSLLYPLKNRLAKYIYDIAIYRNAKEIELKFSQTAEYFGISPRHFRRILSEFEDESILERKYSEIHILNLDKLHDYVIYK